MTDDDLPRLRREYPTAHHDLTIHEQHGARGYSPGRPETDLQALMEAPPHVDPEESAEAIQAKVEPIRRALESGVLDERETWIVEATHWRRLSLQEVADELSLSKSYVHRILEGAQRKLGEWLVAHDIGPTDVEG